MQQMMKQMGIDVDELDAEEVVITKSDGEQLVFDNPDITVMDARGQETYQVVGEPETRGADEATPVESGDAGDDESGGSSGIPDEDVEIVAQQAGASEDDAREALEATDGDLAAAVERLQ
jgi:nascent polypeptide-associated complex subunit alpha